MKYVLLTFIALAFSAAHAEEKSQIYTSIIAHNATIISLSEAGEDIEVKFKTAYQPKEMTATICKIARPFDVKSTIATIKLGTAKIIGNPSVELRMVTPDLKTLCITDAALSIL